MNPASATSVHIRANPRISVESRRVVAKKNAVASVARDAEHMGMPEELGDEKYLAAVRSYRRERWQRAFEQFATLANQGHAPAAKFALLMLRHGNTLYGTPLLAQPAQVALWARCVLGRVHRAGRLRQA